MSDTRPAILIMAKAPRLGNSKSRLRPFVEHVDTLAGAFFADTVNFAKTFRIKIIIAFAPRHGRDELCRLTNDIDELLWVEQYGKDLGERLENAIAFAERNEFGPLLIIGTDSPNLPPEFVVSALVQLSNARSDVVLGPTADGGFYLIGFNEYKPGLLGGINWSSDTVFEETSANAARLGLSLSRLPVWYDVDAIEDLQRLVEDLSRTPERAPATQAWIAAHRRVIQRLEKNTFRQADEG